jgi:adenosylhomocysteinase
VPSPTHLAQARAALRRFARATNLLLTGRTFFLVGDDEQADAVRRVMRAFGSRETSKRPDYVFVTADADWADAAAGGGRLIADLHGGLTARIAERAEGGARDGVLSVDGCDLVPAWHALPPRPALPDAAGRIAWASRHMPLAASFAADLSNDRLLRGRRVAVSMVLEPKTAVLALALRDAGADVAVFAHQYETDDAVASELRSRGVPVFADGTGDAARDRELALQLLDTNPDILLDDGAHVIRLAHEARPKLVDALVGAAEETTSGVRALRAMGCTLGVPVIAVNDAASKTQFDNRYGTGQSCVFAIADTLEAATALRPRHRSFDGATVAVLGFGPVGQGVAQFAQALGATVRVADTDPRAELDARYAGYDTGTADALVPDADIIVSATGVAHTITLELMRSMRDGTVLAVAGGVDDEIEVARLASETSARRADAHVDTFTFDDGHTIAVIDEGGCVNITAGEGNPIEIMDLSFAAQLQAVHTLLAARPRLKPGLIPLPIEADRAIAARALSGATTTEAQR